MNRLPVNTFKQALNARKTLVGLWCNPQSAICRTPGVDAVFIGPSDLSASYGHRGTANGPEMQAIISQAIAVANNANKAVGFCPPTAARPNILTRAQRW